jgi:DHA2 family multidrug resistance protein-like MFS transporter
MSATVDAPKAGRREWIGLAVIALPCLVYAMDLTVLYLAVPHLSADLQPSSAQLLWIVDIYGFLVAALLVTMGTLGDRIGRRRLLLLGAAAFGVASVLAAYAHSAEQLIAARALLGVAGATLAPSTLSLIRNMFLDPKQRSVAVAVWISSFSAGGAVGPLAGGLLLDWFWWGSVFLLALPVMALLLVLGPLLLPEFRDPDAGRLDLLSAAMSLVAVLAVIYGLKQLAQEGLGWPAALSILAGLVVGVGFVRRQRRLADPLLDLRLFGNRAFSAALATNILSFFVGFGILLFIAQYLQLVLGLSPLQAGLWMLPSSVGFIIGSMLAPVLVRRAHPAFVMAAGLFVAAVGFGLLTQLGGASGLAVLVAGSVVFSLGLAPVDTLAADLAVGAAPPQRAGAASALSETSSEFGGALGIATLGSVGTAIYRSQVTDTLPAGVPPQAAEATRDTLGGAVAAASQLPDRLGAALLETARVAFIQGLHLTFAISAALAVGIAILVLILLRGVRTTSQPDGPAGPPPGRTLRRQGGRRQGPRSRRRGASRVMMTHATPVAPALRAVDHSAANTLRPGAKPAWLLGAGGDPSAGGLMVVAVIALAAARLLRGRGWTVRIRAP